MLAAPSRGRNCVYCGKKDVPLEIEHIKPKSLGGTNRISNLTLACRTCNEKKGSHQIETFLSKKPDLLNKKKQQQLILLAGNYLMS